MGDLGSKAQVMAGRCMLFRLIERLERYVVRRTEEMPHRAVKHPVFIFTERHTALTAFQGHHIITVVQTAARLIILP